MSNNNIITAEAYKTYFENSISYNKYLENFQNEIDIGDKSQFAKYLPQNWQRQSRLDRKLKLKEDLSTVVANLERKMNWLLITEHWCGDASQINPIINKVASESKGKIDLRFIYRDQNEELIDAHLTDGRSRSIPILLMFDQEFNLIDQYGPRPSEAQSLVMSILTEGGDYNIPLHTWYAKDKQQSVQDDLVRLLEA